MPVGERLGKAVDDRRGMVRSRRRTVSTANLATDRGRIGATRRGPAARRCRTVAVVPSRSTRRDASRSSVAGGGAGIVRMAQALATATSASGTTNSRSGCLTVRTGHGAVRTTRSATLPISRCASARRPCVPITIRSIGVVLRVLDDRFGGADRRDDGGRGVERRPVLISDERFDAFPRIFFELRLQLGEIGRSTLRWRSGPAMFSTTCSTWSLAPNVRARSRPYVSAASDGSPKSVATRMFLRTIMKHLAESREQTPCHRHGAWNMARLRCCAPSERGAAGNPAAAARVRRHCICPCFQ